jgi:uncharacterized protein (TIGR02145 family)
MRCKSKTPVKTSEMSTTTIGTQEWVTEDLKVTKFHNGEDIPLVTDNKQWSQLTTAAYCITPDGNYLYNWYAVNDSRGLAPEGFHVPSDDEWTELTKSLGGEDIAGKELKSTDWNGTNSSGFSASPKGFRDSNYGIFYNLGFLGYWWSATAYDTHYAYSRDLTPNYSDIYRNYFNLQSGFSVRCIKTQIK